MEESGRYRDLKKKLYDLQNDFRIQFVRMKLQAKESKAERDKRRKENIPEYEMSEMIRESQFQKAELKRFERQKLSEINAVKEELSVCEDMIPALKEKRKTLSIGLQKKIFDHYIVHSAKGNSISLTDLFGQSTGQLPPSGAGECAAPKLLQYAFKNKLKPVVMAEFWYGDSPKNEIRRHGCYYPACKSKCEPILKFMLQGLIIEDALSVYDKAVAKLEIIFEDEYLFVVNKPQGLLSVKGKKKYDTVISKVREQTNYTGDLFIVHRLDMDTSGLMALAKAKSVYKALQKQFLDRKVEKCYVALLDGIVKEKEGEINLPLCPDPENRPRQIVNYELGKKAKTIFKVIEEKDNKTRIEFCPVTGRTHQLRVHAAHPDGLNTPVSGDRLYGCPSDRMCLHAQSLMFDHPVTAKRLCFVKKASF
jgi:tRNA pseudouridine32 synthase/23S rRNA pseudouridine746 synthase